MSVSLRDQKKSRSKYGKPDAVKVARPVCAVRRVVVYLLQAGGIEEVFLGYQSTRMRKLKGTGAD
jgi:hypothetical protein